MAAWWKNKSGQSVMEVLVAVAVFAVLAGGVILLVLDPLTSSASASDRTRATFLATQGLEAARALKENLWTDLTVGTHGLAKDLGGNWIFSGVSDVVDGVFTRA
ncbi:MAG TPA: prepilin-type N-terminal cleavage/methylation domain-containing protein, partial [Patescibacteria group bacterium]|nr:prepilin-type N-terminal cleavage/methylation domain-containing protein [Patescibacteria group bacterium]